MIATHYYRFTFILQKAIEMANEVRAFGGALLAALEKQDAEDMAKLRSTHEIALLSLVLDIKSWQLDEARATKTSLNHTKKTFEIRRQFYADNISNDLNDQEKASLLLTETSLGIRIASAAAFLASSVLSLIPEAKIAFVTSLGATYGGENVKGVSEGLGRALGQSTSLLDAASALAKTMGEHTRGHKDWEFQLDSAKSELRQIEQQIAASTLRVSIAQREIDNHNLQIKNACEVDDRLKSKFTQKQLYEPVAQTH